MVVIVVKKCKVKHSYVLASWMDFKYNLIFLLIFRIIQVCQGEQVTKLP